MKRKPNPDFEARMLALEAGLEDYDQATREYLAWLADWRWRMGIEQRTPAEPAA